MTGDIFQHFKGMKYEECGTSELHGQEVVVYKKLYDDFSHWIRPIVMFNDYKELDGKKVKRFTKVEETKVKDNPSCEEKIWKEHRETFKEPFRLFKLGVVLTIAFITLDYYGKLANNLLILLNFLPILIYSIDLVLFKQSVNRDLQVRRKNNKKYIKKDSPNKKVYFEYKAKHSETEEELIVASDKKGALHLFSLEEWNGYEKVEVKGKYLTTTGFNMIMLQLSFLLYHLLSNLNIANIPSLRYVALAFGIHGIIQLKRNLV